MKIPRRQLFLYRNIRKFKLRNALRNTSVSDEPSSPESLATKSVNDNSTTKSTLKPSSTMDSVTVQIDESHNSGKTNIVINNMMDEKIIATETESSNTISGYVSFRVYCQCLQTLSNIDYNDFSSLTEISMIKIKD